MHLGADARVDAHGADVGAVTAVALDEVDRALHPVEQGVQIAKQLLFRAEHAAEVVAGAGGEGADRHVLAKRRAADALVEGPVAPAGVDTQALAAFRLPADLPRGVHGSAGHIDLIRLLPAPEGLPRAGADLIGLVAAAGDGIDDEQVLHFVCPLSMYIKRSHLIMPL